MFKNLFALFLLCLASPCFSQEVVSPPYALAGTSVKGLELPADQTVRYDEGFISIKAECAGEVKWLVISQHKVKYVVVPQNTIIISIPPDVPEKGGIINVFAVGLVEGKLTDFARTNILVSRGNTPAPTPNPNPPSPNPPTPNPPEPNPNPLITGKLHFTFLVDMNKRTPAMAKLLNSETLVKGLNERGHWFRQYDITTSIVDTKGLRQEVQKVGGNEVLIVQSESGAIVSSRVIPRTEAEIFAFVQQLTGK